MCVRGASTAACTFMPYVSTLSSDPRTIVMMRPPPGLPVTMTSLPFFVTIVGAIDESGRFPGAPALASPCVSPFKFAVPGLAEKVVHLVVQQKAGVAGDDRRAETRVERVRHGDRIARERSTME